ncbi:D-aspartate oxidase-like isoform X1 [Mercenaria mercenaria]|uniref:D-aspartate oxidase-like isoform X1 n=1 Tax=Mercenaria mercenaria TaxID=6596 RepID=UPI00234F069B|nr:D-aspartate oxidase-like isoform X1 [Mercenaria mercenaria]XP_045193021.2 D-aspartate oxidase-like isoform X1 [Mercenaria mercenaria]XP_045193022.2 D-aspartate oxidase-like isoform X1 [Mercenaria mercenaria]XP_045193023.2 D-aspartate oxidase-like isoform X1 [Mercenaria mercenaria]XP_045193025.2 D-aspartate oxidase-like isoform X1 [Mercenaria mercenaria]XP_045193026.2 D-aspartate oxidase-like isoform X1 [Mercenaria mercenaria]
MPKIAVIGAGVVGLSTAINIQKRQPSAKVTIIADRFDKQTTSHGAGGLFRPNVEHLLGVNPDTVTRWSVEGFKFYSSLAVSPESRDTGHMIMPGYVFSNTEIQNPLYKSLVFSFRQLTPDELRKLSVNYKYGYQVTTVITDCSRFLPWLMTRFKERGGTVENRHVKSLEEFVGEYDVVVNCAGFSSRDLVGDKSVYPVRGHLIRLKAPWIKYWVYTEDSAYFIPSFDAVAIGGIRQKNNFSLDIDPKDTAGILERCYKLWPSLKGAPIQSEWVDLRPHRDPLRLEKEVMKFPKGSLNVVHNYGHGALGIALAWGTSIDAAKLAVEDLHNIPSKL